MKQKKILIFGGRGFIGQHLIKRLDKHANVKIYPVGNIGKSIKTKKIINKKITLIKYNYAEIFNIIKKISPHTILYLSGNPAAENSNEKYLYDYKSSNLPLVHILESIKNIDNNILFFFSSTIGVYKSGKKPKSEEGGLNPISYYAISKVISEAQCRFYSNKFDLKITILRLASTFGPALSRQLVYDAIKKLDKKNKSYNFYGSGNETRDLMYIEEMVKAIEILIRKKFIKSDIYNISSGKRYKVSEIIKIIAKLKGIKFDKIKFNETNNTNLADNWSMNIDKLKKLGFKPNTNIESQIRTTINYWNQSK